MKKNVIPVEWIADDRGFVDSASVTFLAEDGDRVIVSKQIVHSEGSRGERDRALYDLLAIRETEMDTAHSAHIGPKKYLLE